jgi:hypothetical protein
MLLLRLVCSGSDSGSASDEDWDGFTPRKYSFTPISDSTQASGSGVKHFAGGGRHKQGRSLYYSVASLFGIEVYRYLLAG